MPPKRLDAAAPGFETDFSTFLGRNRDTDENVDRVVADIIADVRARVVNRSRTRVLVMVNILRSGMGTGKENDPAIQSSMVYAYAAIREGIPYANAAPNPLLGDEAARLFERD